MGSRLLSYSNISFINLHTGSVGVKKRVDIYIIMGKLFKYHSYYICCWLHYYSPHLPKHITEYKTFISNFKFVLMKIITITLSFPCRTRLWRLLNTTWDLTFVLKRKWRIPIMPTVPSFHPWLRGIEWYSTMYRFFCSGTSHTTFLSVLESMSSRCPTFFSPIKKVYFSTSYL